MIQHGEFPGLSDGDAILLLQGAAKSGPPVAVDGIPNRTARTASESDRRKVLDALHAGCSHRGPGGIERAGQIDRPAPRLDYHGLEAELARVHRGVVNAKIGREPGEEDSPQAALAQITRKAGESAPIVFIERGVGIDFGANPFRITSSARSVASCG